MRLTASAAFKSGSFSPRQLVGIAGPYWQHFFDGQEEMLAVLKTTAQQNRQNLRQLTEMVFLSNFNDAPLYHTETFYPVRVPVRDVTRRPLRYGGEAQYGTPSGNEIYGQVFNDGYALPLSTPIKDGVCLLDRPHNSRYAAVFGGSAWLVGNAIEMRDNPADVFTQVQFNDEPHYLVWVYMADLDNNYLTRQYGPLLGQSFSSAEPQKLAIKYAMNAMINGPSEWALRGVLAAATGTDIAMDGEVVKHVLDDGFGVSVITDQRTMHAPDGALQVVQVGDVLRSGDYFFDTVYTSAPGTLPSFLSAVTFPEGLTKDEPFELTFGNLAATAETRDGKLYIYPTVTGDSDFWTAINNHSPSLATGVMNHYDIVTANPDTASPAIVPSQVDFASVLFQQIFAYKLSVSLLDSAQLVPGSIEILRLIRLVTPPWVQHLLEFTDQPPEGWIKNAAECC